MEKIYMLNNSNGETGLFLGLKSRISPMRPLLTMLALLMVCLFGVNENAWGQTYNTTYSGIKWYSLFDSDEYSNSGDGDHNEVKETVVPPTSQTISVDWRKDRVKVVLWYNTGFDLWIDKTSQSNRIVHSTVVEQQDDWKTANGSVGENATSVSVWFQNSTNGKGHIKNIRIPMKKHILLSGGTNGLGLSTDSKAFGEVNVEATTDPQTVTFRSFLTDGDISVSLTNGDPEVFRLGTADSIHGVIRTSSAGKSYAVGADACASANGAANATAGGSTLGDISKYGFNVYFRPKAATTYNGTITITDGHGHMATVTLSGTGKLRDNSISWTPDTIGKKNWGDYVLANATATNNESGCPAINYSVESGKESYVTIANGKITFNQAGAGKTVKITASQAANYKYKAASQSRTFTIKQSQVIVWDETKVDTNIQIGKTRDIADYTYADPASSRAITYSSADKTKMTVSGTTITAKGLGDVDIIATLAGDADYNVVTSSKTFTVTEKETPAYYLGEDLIGENAALAMNVGDSTDIITSKNKDTLITYVSTHPDVAIFNTKTQRIDAKGAGSTKITLSQVATDDYKAGTCEIDVTVSLNETNITTNVNEKTMEVGDEYDPELNTNNGEVTMTITTKKNGVVAYEAGKLKALGAGKDTITFTQAANDKWTKGEKSIIVTVNKKEPIITITGVPATAWNTTIEPTISSTNKDPKCAISIEKHSGADAAARLINNTIHVYDKNGETVTFRVSQEGNDTCVAVHQDFSFTVQKSSNHVTYVKGDVTLAKDKDQTIEFTGVPKQVVFTPTSGALADRDYKLHWGTTKETTTNHFATFDKSDEGNQQTVDIDPSARALRVEFAGAYLMNKNTTGTFQGLTITERKEIVVKGLTSGYYDFGTWEVGNQATDRAIGIEWYSVPTTTVTSSNPGVFDVITETINSEIDDFSKSASVVIRYHHKRVTPGTQDEATITLTSENGYTTSFKVKGKTIKKDQTLIWQDELSPIEVGTVIPNAAIAPLALNYTITSTTEDGVVELDGTVLKAKKVGEVTIHVANNGDEMWNPVEGECTIKVTDLKVQHIRWNKTFTRLTTSDADVNLDATAYEYVNGEEVAITARSISYTSSNPSVVTVVNGKLHVVGVGTATLTASIPGVDGVYEPASVTRKVKVRVKSTGCVPYAIENESADIKTHIYDFTGSEKVYSLNGVEPNQVTFEAWREDIMGFTDGKLFVAESTDNGSSWTELQGYSINEGEENATTCGPKSLSREATHIKIYKKTGATGYHNFKNLDVTKAKYLELDDTKNKTTMDISFPAEETHLGQTYIKSVVVNYSNIYDMLYVNHTNSNFRITPTEIGEGCGEDSRATITIIYYAKEAINESDVITITDEHGLTATINVSAVVSKSDQTITWNPNTNLVTTDEVTFDATASSGLAVSYSLEEGDADVATLTTSGVLTIKTAGDIHVTASQAGSETLYNSVALEPITFHISKVTPSVSVKPTVSAVTLPKTLNDVTLNVTNAKMLNDKGAEVEGTYAWVDGTTVVTEGDYGYPVLFTPSNGAWYNDTIFDVTVSASKRNQTITWDFVGGQTLPCSAIVPLNATIKDSLTNELLDVELTYTSDNTNCANIDKGELVVKTPGEVTITVSRAGDETYNAASITRTITFVKTTPVIDTLPTANSIYEGQMLSESAITGGYVRSGSRQVVGSFVWTTENFKAVTIGTQNYNIQFIPSNEDCYERVDTVIPMRILQIERIFTDSIGDGDWSNPDNWSNGFVPPVSNVNVTVSEDVTIDGTASVGSITIPENKDVTITVSGQLTINGTPNSSNDEYANVIVKDGGQLAVTGMLDVNDLIIEASLGDYTPNNAHPAASGQVSGEDKINVNGDVYFKISFDPAGKISYGWYDFTVPFEVDVMEGIYDSVGNKLTNNYDYAIMEFSEAQRAVNAKAWNWFSGTLQPGTLYSITLDADRDWNTFLFKRKSSEANYGSNTYEASCTNSGETTDRGWNGLGNGTLQHCQLNHLPAQTKIQIYDHKTDRYVERVAAGYTYAVGTAFFVQVAADGDIDLTSVDEPRDFLAPTRERRSVEEFDLALTAEDEENAADHLWVSASEEATGEYVIGHDLVKMGTPTSAKVAQMWCARNNINLCDIEMPLVANKAQTPLSIFAPKAGSYELAIDAAPEDATLYLTYNGSAIWNLSMSAYEFELEQGTTEGYGLRIVASEQTTTDIENGGLLNDENGVRKVLIDNVIYVVTPEGKMYDIVGKGIKF